jgi:hypothetical protein
MSFPRVLGITILALGAGLSAIAMGQANPASNGNSLETIADLLNKMNESQRTKFNDGRTAYAQKRYSDAIAKNQELLKDFPGDPVLLKLCSQSALQNGDPGFALKTLKPIVDSNGQDWQAVAMLVRACAETGDTACRDQQIAHLVELHGQGVTPAQFREFTVETIKVGEKSLSISFSLAPWGPYKTYAVGDVKDGAGKLLVTISLESSDFDQGPFAKEHPDQAAKGVRLFSLDAYEETGTNGSGQRTQTHYTYKFFNGQPAYATIREEFMNVAGGKSKPLSSRSGLVVE